MIYKFQPFSTTKELGKEYNAHCALVPNDDDWILILDYDVMILVPETYKVIEAAIARYPEVKIFGAMTNRIGLSGQKYNGLISDNDSMKHHIQIAKDLAEAHKDGECHEINYVAGFFMLFQKSYWRCNPFQPGIFNERGNLFDYEFCKPLLKQPGTVQVIKGAYLLHKYRIDRTSHLNRDHLK